MQAEEVQHRVIRRGRGALSVPSKVKIRKISPREPAAVQVSGFVSMG